MESKEVLAAGLALPKPWDVKNVCLKNEDQELVLHNFLDHTRRTKFRYEEKDYAVYGHQVRT